jgi:hypothetical protein
MKKNLTSVLLLISLVFLFQSCKNSDSGAWVNNNIDNDIRTQIGELNKKLFKGIMSNDTSAVLSLLSPQLLKSAKKEIDTLVGRSSMSYNAKEYTVLDEYYTKSIYKNRLDTLSSTRGNIYDYVLNFHATNKEAYASLLISKDIPVNCILLVLYGKYGNTWKINSLQIGQYSINNKTAPDYYKDAMAQYNSGNLVDAVNLMGITAQLAYPIGSYFQYKLEDSMKTACNKVLIDADLKYQLPFFVDQISTRPQLFSIGPKIVEEANHGSIYPLIKYKSTIKLTDTVALKAENTALQKVIGSVFKGIDQNKNYIFYQAYDQIPDNKTPNIKYYGFVQKIKQN